LDLNVVGVLESPLYGVKTRDTPLAAALWHGNYLLAESLIREHADVTQVVFPESDSYWFEYSNSKDYFYFMMLMFYAGYDFSPDFLETMSSRERPKRLAVFREWLKQRVEKLHSRGWLRSQCGESTGRRWGT